ncbi:MAG: hypothetical protein ACLUV4_06145 [Prevotella sp.]
MITIPNKDFKSSNIMLQQIIHSTTKVKMLKVCKKFDLYVSPNLRKDETSRRIALEVMDNPIEILSRLSKTELLILDEFARGGDIFVVRKQRKTPYILQKYLLVVTYCDDEKNEWHMLMPTELRESLAPSLPFFLACAMKGVKAPSAKELRVMSALQRFMGDE